MLMLVFFVGDERYALDSSQIVEVIPRVTLKPLPRAPDSVAGLFNYRGGIVPVIDLSQVIAGRPCQPRLSTRIILVQYPGDDGAAHILGLMVEHVTEAVQVKPADLVSPGIQVEEAPYLGEIITDEQGMIQRVRIESVLPESLRQSLFRDPESYGLSG